MAHKKLIDFRQELFDLHANGSYSQALEMLAEEGKHFPDRQDDIYFWKACFFALDNQAEQAINILEQGIEDGYWWKPEFLHTEQDLVSLYGRPAFERLLEECDHRYKSAKVASQAKLHNFLPPMSAPIPYPVLLAMHGHDMDPQITMSYWKPATNSGCFVAVPQSSQISGINRFLWDDEKRARKEIEGHLEEVQDEPAIARDKIILGGFSQGGQRAISFALHGVGEALGFIVVTPSISEDEMNQLKTMIDERMRQSLRGYIITGEEDPRKDRAIELHRLLQNKAMASELEVHPNLGHQYPQNFEASLTKAIKFILDK